MKKKVAIIGVILLVVAYIIFSVISYAGSEVIYVGLNTTHHNGEGYGIGNPKSGGLGIWNLRNYDSTNRNDESSVQKELYCLKGDYGDSWEQNSGEVIEYNLSYDLNTEREKLLQLLEGVSSQANTVVTDILSDSSSGIYKELLWVMDNAFIPGVSDKNQLLERIGILYDETDDIYYYEPVNGYDYSDKIYSQEWTTSLTETDIKAVQQAVIWYFTNAKLDNDSTFDKIDATDWLTITVDDGSSYSQLVDYNKSTGEGLARYDQANILYNYLINSAIKNADNYTSNGYEKPVEVDLTGLTLDADGKYELESNRNGDNYITGPIKINKNNERNYDITLKITNATTGTEVSSSNYTFTDENGTALGTTDITTLVGRTDGFYISIPRTVAKEINIDMTINYANKNKKIWLSGTEDGTTSVTLNAEQPVLEVEEVSQTDSVKLTATPKEFDLALRKYITKVNGTGVTDSRVPNISENTLESGTTATYSHRKDPVVVKKGDIVTYKITIYNEGNKNGYATEITDQLPTGLKYTGGATITSNKNTYSVTYTESTNKLTFTATTSTALNAYATNSLDSETLEFTCEVTANPDTDNDKILTNVAWISGAYDSDAGKDITAVGDDRDSRPQTYPSADKDSMENYKGNSSNKTDLTDNTYHYQGEQDDDDFEKLLIEPETSITVTKTWDDNSNQDGIRPTSIDVSLYADGIAVSGKTATLSNSNSWTYTFTGLPVKSNGSAITYSVAETSDVTGYNASVNGFTITNTHEPAKTDISVEKVWDDNSNQDGIRPTSISVSLLADGTAVSGKTVTLNSTNSWKYTFTDLPVYSNGTKIIYTVEETSIPTGYSAETTGDETTGFTITNTHTPETTQVSVEKVWNDSNDQDGLRPDSISVSLLANGTAVDGKTVTLDESNTWKYTFTDLPVYSSGIKITYTVSEAGVPNEYTSETTGDAATGFTITNTHTPETTQIPVEKVWNDSNDQDGLRPDSISVSLLADGIAVSGKTVTLNSTNNWKYTFADLPVYSGGTKITYTVSETGVPSGYISETTGDATAGYTITNTHIPETTQVPVEKVWNDSNDQDGLRPTNITVKLLSDGTAVSGKTATLDESNSWKYTFKDLPVYSNGTKIEYTVQETSTPTGYSSETTGDAVTGFIITNTHTPGIISVSVEKVWDDKNDQDKIRPTEITVRLLADGIAVSGKEITLNDTNTWKYTFTDLPEKQDGIAIKYTVEETTVPDGYTANVTGDMVNGFTITNTHKIFDLALRKYITKVNGNNVTDNRVPNISETTLGTGTTATYKQRKDPVKVSENDIVTYAITVYNEGEKTGYASQIIDQLPTGLIYNGGSTVISKDSAGTTKNTYTVTYESTTNKITFDITGIPEDLQPYETGNLDSETIEIQCKVVAQADTTNNKILTNVAWISGVYDTVDQAEAKDRDSQTTSSPNVDKDNNIEDYTGNTNNKTDLTDNTYYYEGEQDDDDFEKLVIEPEAVSVSVSKVWEDNSNQDGMRTTEVTVQLLADGTEVSGKTATLNESNSWTYTFKSLPKKSAGVEINYTVAEVNVPTGYTSETTGDMTNGFTITNTHTPETINIPVTKVWEDSNNQDGKRPTEITITLLANGEEVEEKSVKLNVSNSWTYTFTDLPKKENGVDINYTISETGIPQGYTSETTGDMTNGFTITNTYIPEKISIPVKKVWVDNDNQDGIRPTSITLILKSNRTEAQRQTLTGEGNEWTYTFSDLPKYSSGTEIIYTVEEEGAPEVYASLTTGSISTGFTITNTYTPGNTSVSVEKVWNDNNDQDGIRPDSVSVSLIANGDETNPVQTIDLSESNGWAYTFTDLPEKENGEDITYTVIENTVIEGYTTTITNDNTTSTSGEIQTTLASEYTITNTHETYLTSVKVTKVWQDEENADKIRPESVKVQLYKVTESGNVAVEGQEVTLSEENNWAYTFENLQANEDGNPISYTVEEVQVPTGYTASVSGTMEVGFTITNTHNPEKIFDLALRKYITKINNNELTTLGFISRVPNISETTLQSGTTAIYKHRKDPVEVEEGDIVTYKITIYNEGDKTGYAKQIIDQLPTGLIYNPSNTVVSTDSNGVEKNTYTVTYDTTTNKITFDIVNTEENPAKELNSYETGNLDSETIELKCKVTYKAQAGKSNILTNVAWINEAFNTFDNIEVTNVGDDRDSEPGTKPNVNKDNMEDYKGNDNNKNDLTDSSYHYEGEQDDDDFEKLYVKTFDLSLRKFVESVNGEGPEPSREPEVDVTSLQNGTSTTVIYKQPKTPVSLKAGDTVIYTIRVYNEGEVDGYANEVTDYLPPYLEYVENSTINSKYGWQISEDGRIATTTYLSNKEISHFDGTTLDYEDIQIECTVAENAIPSENITNIAEISEYKYGDTVVPEDIDSSSDNIDENLPEDKDLPDYKKDEENNEYVPGNEDDDDFEKVYVKEFDLALRKFITEVQEKEVTTREPQVKYEDGQISYEQTKDPVTLHVGDVVIYTLRIYNEGEIDGYASEITDDIPEYLEYLPDEATNVQYMWKMYDENGNETENVDEAVKVKTTYLSKENGEDNLLKAFDGNTLYYRDIKIAFKVKDPNSNTYIITNYAQISDDTDENGNEIKDKDSETDKWNEGEDDQDVENVKVEYFDLSILKFVSKVIVQEDGQEKITQTGYNGHEDPEPVVKVELHKKKLDNVVVKFGYGITVTNEGDVPGYATELTDYVPEGLKFEASDNPNWTDEGNNVISTKQLENTLLQPGQSETVEVILTWINGAENLALKTNIVEISDDNNEYGVPDRDSTPDNQKDGEDDIDLAKVILAISTGSGKTYFMLTIGLLSIVGVGVALIKKYVL